MNRIVYNDGTVTVVTEFDKFCNEQVSQFIFSANDREYIFQINKSLSDDKLLFIGNCISDTISGEKHYGYYSNDFYPYSDIVIKSWKEKIILRQGKIEYGEDSLELYESTDEGRKWIGCLIFYSLEEIRESDTIKSLLSGLVKYILPEAFEC